MKALYWIACLCVLYILVSGCGGSSKNPNGKASTTGDGKPADRGLIGKYNRAGKKSYLELKSDGTFFSEQIWEGGRAGKYAIEGEKITLETNAGEAVRGKIDGKAIILTFGPSEERYTRE